MRKFTLLLSLVVFVTVGFAQKAAVNTNKKFVMDFPSVLKGESDITDTLVPASFETGTPTLYTASEGYVCGANGYGDIGKAQHFNSGAETYMVEGVMLWIGAQEITDGNLKFAVYGFDGGPTTALASMEIPFAQVTSTEVGEAGDFWYSVIFDTPVEVSGEFAVGIEFADITDGFGLISTTEGDGGVDAWELWGDGSGWYSFLDGSSWGLDIDQAIFPLVSPKQQVVALPIDFETEVAISSWSSTTAIVDNPFSGGNNTSAKVAQHDKEAGNAWAGCLIQLTEPLDLSVNSIFSMQVYMPAVKTPILFKLESSSGAAPKEVWEKNTVANAWETIKWNFDGATTGVYDKVVLFFNAGVDAAGTYYFDDIELGKGVKVTFNIDMAQPILDPNYFVAGTDSVFVTGSFANGAGETWGWDMPNTGESLMMSDENGDGIYTVTVQMPENTTGIKYKYFINGNWDTGDQVGGDRLLELTTTDVTLDDVWVHEVSVSDINLNAVTIAPNPFNGTLVINNAEKAAQIVVSNVLGQQVMTVNKINNRQEISTESLSKGVYLITIIDQYNNMRTERVVKQ